MADFDPVKHPRNTRGEFSSVLDKLEHGESVHLPGGVHVKKSVVSGMGGRTTVFGVKDAGADKGRGFPSPKEAADHALTLSARSSHPDSLGGARSHKDLPAALKANRARARRGAGKPKDVPNPTRLPTTSQSLSDAQELMNKADRLIMTPAERKRKRAADRRDKRAAKASELKPGMDKAVTSAQQELNRRGKGRLASRSADADHVRVPPGETPASTELARKALAAPAEPTNLQKLREASRKAGVTNRTELDTWLGKVVRDDNHPLQAAAKQYLAGREAITSSRSTSDGKQHFHFTDNRGNTHTRRSEANYTHASVKGDKVKFHTSRASAERAARGGGSVHSVDVGKVSAKPVVPEADRAAAKALARTPHPDPPTERKAFEFVRNQFATSTDEVAQHLNVSKANARKILNGLEAKGIIGGEEMHDYGGTLVSGGNLGRARGHGKGQGSGYIDKTWQSNFSVDDHSDEEALALARSHGMTEAPFKMAPASAAAPKLKKPLSDTTIKTIHNHFGKKALEHIDAGKTAEVHSAAVNSEPGVTMGQQSARNARISAASALHRLAQEPNGRGRLQAHHDATVDSLVPHAATAGHQRVLQMQRKNEVRDAQHVAESRTVHHDKQVRVAARKEATALRNLAEAPDMGTVHDAARKASEAEHIRTNNLKMDYELHKLNKSDRSGSDLPGMRERRAEDERAMQEGTYNPPEDIERGKRNMDAMARRRSASRDIQAEQNVENRTEQEAAAAKLTAGTHKLGRDIKVGDHIQINGVKGKVAKVESPRGVNHNIVHLEGRKSTVGIPPNRLVKVDATINQPPARAAKSLHKLNKGGGDLSKLSDTKLVDRLSAIDRDPSSLEYAESYAEAKRRGGFFLGGLPEPTLGSDLPQGGTSQGRHGTEGTSAQQLERLAVKDVTPTDAERNRGEFASAGATQAQIAQVVGAWTGAGSSVEYSPEQQRQQVRDDIKAGKLDNFVQAAENGPKASVLFRVIPSEDQLGGLKAGSTIDMRGVSSFSPDKSSASRFGAGRKHVMVELHDANGLPVKGISNTPWENEWLVTGHAQVNKVTDLGDGNVHVVASWHPGPSKTQPTAAAKSTATQSSRGEVAKVARPNQLGERHVTVGGERVGHVKPLGNGFTAHGKNGERLSKDTFPSVDAAARHLAQRHKKTKTASAQRMLPSTARRKRDEAAAPRVSSGSGAKKVTVGEEHAGFVSKRGSQYVARRPDKSEISSGHATIRDAAAAVAAHHRRGQSARG